MKKVISFVLLMFVVGIASAQRPVYTRDLGVIPSGFVVKEHYGTPVYGGGLITSGVKFEIKAARPVAIIPSFSYPGGVQPPHGTVYIIGFYSAQTVLRGSVTQTLSTNSLPPGVYIAYTEAFFGSAPQSPGCTQFPNSF